MKYRYNFDDACINQRVCKINNIDPKDIDVSNFCVDYNIGVLKEFREKLLSYKDLKFFIVGDYDCDGICATTIIKKLLDDLNIQNNYYIPSRSKEGYGINDKIVETAFNNNFDVLLMVDNGICASSQLALAKSYNLKTLIIDHHEYQEEPECNSYLHPSLFNDDYKDMCAAGLCALLSNSIREDDLNYVFGGIASIGDMVSVLHYNRYLIKKMYNILQNKEVYPIDLLLGKGDLYNNISYNLIPKINAVSRLDEFMNVNYVVKFLLANEKDCLPYYEKIELINDKRKELTNQSYHKAKLLLDENANVIIVRSNEFKEGLCGLIANKLMHEYGKATIVLTETDGVLKGSGRAPIGCNLYEYLNKISDIFDSFGGHAQAVGLSINNDNFEELIKYVNLNELIYVENIADVLIFSQDNIDNNIIYEMDELRPFGNDFVEPLIGICNADVKQSYVINGKYPKFVLNDKLEAISFNSNNIDKTFNDIIGKLKIDNYRINKLSLVIEDLL